MDSAATVLVVDDYEDARVMTCEALRILGFATATAASADAALGSAMTVRPDVIVLELEIDGATGVDLVSSLRSQRGLSRVAVVALTRNTDLALHEAARRAGCHAVLTKPAELEQLERAIREALATVRDANS